MLLCGTQMSRDVPLVQKSRFSLSELSLGKKIEEIDIFCGDKHVTLHNPSLR